jgi:hypothetical protein|tara:strand:- start:96 stop:290 length:195 start_codon:yes stop_codon:yes gene_type:complete
VITRDFLKVLVLATFVAALSSCAEEEQNRLLSYEKGTYLGPADQSLSDEQVRKLMTRADIQRVY